MVAVLAFAVFCLALLVPAQPAAACAGADPAIVSVAVKGVTTNGDVNVYHLSGTVANVGTQKQASNVLQFVDVYEDGSKVDARGIPPLRPGQRYSFTYDFKRAVAAAAGSTHFRFLLDFRQPSPPGSQDCSAGNDTFALRV
jgi:hypothetical protein